MLVEARKEQLASLNGIKLSISPHRAIESSSNHKSYVHEQREPVQHNERLEFLGMPSWDW